MKFEIVMLLAIAAGVAFIGVVQRKQLKTQTEQNIRFACKLVEMQNEISYLTRENDKLRGNVNDLTVRIISPTPPKSELGPPAN